MDLRMITRGAWLCGVAFLLNSNLSLGQGSKTVLTEAEYAAHKASNTLPAHFVLQRKEQAPIKPEVTPAGEPKGGGNSCDCWIAPDANYTLAMPANDDGSSPPITIPFQFDLYNDLYSIMYINNNGNVSFDAPWATFTATGFPTASFAMVAPFWGDVDTRGADGMGLNGGEVWYRVTPTAVYVNWVEVGYYDSHTDKHNSFQLILTDGTDPVIGIGNNVGFCYQEMEWTTGDASGGILGFLGSPATVGANRGNGTDYIQFGTFDQPGIAYDGPFLNPDGIDWLDNKDFKFTTAVITSNVPPIPNSLYLCDTLVVCTDQQVNIQMDFISPEQNQVTTATSSSGLSNYAELSNTSGINASIVSQFTPTVADLGFQTIDYSATDNGVPPLTTTVNIVVEVVQAPVGPPTISGDSIVCNGAVANLMASSGFTSYLWSSGQTTSAVAVSGGTYTVTGFIGGCALTSTPITVLDDGPIPVITGATANCGGQPSLLQTSQQFASYQWSNGDTTATITTGTGSFSVTVMDVNGCTGTSAPVNVLSAPDPTALFNAQPASPTLPGTFVQFTDASTGNGGNIVDWSYTIDNNTVNGPNTSYTFNDPGVYTITLTVTTADGCTNTYSFDHVVIPDEIILPNVISPNGDSQNDILVIEGIQGYPNSLLQIYNRWGQVIYETKNYRNNWRAKDVSEGTYYIILKLNNGEEMTGHLTIVR